MTIRGPGRYYFVTVAPANAQPLDEGMSLKVLLPARDRKHAMRRARRYVPGIIQAVQVVRWTESLAPRLVREAKTERYLARLK